LATNVGFTEFPELKKEQNIFLMRCSVYLVHKFSRFCKLWAISGNVTYSSFTQFTSQYKLLIGLGSY